MKKKLLIFTSLLIAGTMQAQEISDALRYSQNNLTGTARFRAMSGAFGALGGDLSSINVNPAGSVVFLNNQLGLSLSSFNATNNSNYFDSKATENNNQLEINQLGAVFVFKNNDPNTKWRKFTLGINYENTHNYDNTSFAMGTNPFNSIDSYFLSFANGVPLGVITGNNFNNLFFNEQQAFLGYEGYVINPVNDNSNNSLYTSNVPSGGNYYHENYVVASGFNGKVSFNMATQYEDKISLGLNLNSHFTDFRRSSTFFEDNSNNPQNGLQALRFDNDLHTYGNGFSFQLGSIFKITNELRAGLAYESPTWYRLNDELQQRLVTVDAIDGENFNNDINPRVINLFPTYRLKTPSRWTASTAYIFGKKGLLSIDYTYVDYSNIEFRPTSDSYFRSLNNQMNNLLNGAHELRLGAEVRLQEWSLRGGYRFEQSPYKNGHTIGDLNSLSAGFGYNFGATKVDLAYMYAKRNLNQGFFAQGFTDGANISNVNNNVTLSLLFEL